MRSLIAPVLVWVAVVSAQDYRCDWSVVGIGGGEMSGTAYRCGATAGQTATGQLAGASYAALIGFWQTDYAVGIREAAAPVGPAEMRTALLPAQPSVFRGRTTLRYTLACPGPAALNVHDLAGRVVRSWAIGAGPTAAGSVSWDGRDDAGRRLASGVYVVRFLAGSAQLRTKAVIAGD
jgi:hypothetical protein